MMGAYESVRYSNVAIKLVERTFSGNASKNSKGVALDDTVNDEREILTDQEAYGPTDGSSHMVPTADEA
ncbi:hypothetical protein MAM1_0349d09924 [Mucor ambiguus]|uniref:Uncharacterized protein n=1 Tax=Mucor ambiguus TaxID=91626 RepID=A0A0C9MSG9_9FUNG|nr:hypothetical protein MAM1_0349d09924 [Mucor ambiguus]